MRRIATASCLAGLLLAATAGSAGAASLVPGSLDFGNQAAGTTGAPKSVVLNRDSDPVFSVSIAITGEFNMTHNCPALLAPLLADSCTISVSFAPTGPGLRTGTLFANSLVFGGPMTMLSGTGTDQAGGAKACEKGKKKKKGRKKHAAASKRKGKKKGKGCKKKRGGKGKRKNK